MQMIGSTAAVDTFTVVAEGIAAIFSEPLVEITVGFFNALSPRLQLSRCAEGSCAA